MKLIDKLKPEVIEALDEAKIQYSSSHRSIFATLNSVSEYKDLTVDQLNLITAYLPQDLKPYSEIGWMYGDNILDKKTQIIMETKQKLPKWFTGELYDEGAEVQNRFSGDKCQLNNVELSMYDFVMGATMCMEMGMPCNVTDLRKGLDWFRKNNAEAYMILLD